MIEALASPFKDPPPGGPQVTQNSLYKTRRAANFAYTANATVDMRSEKKQTLLFRKSGTSKNQKLSKAQQHNSSNFKNSAHHSSSRGLTKECL